MKLHHRPRRERPLDVRRLNIAAMAANLIADDADLDDEGDVLRALMGRGYGPELIDQNIDEAISEARSLQRLRVDAERISA
ncbi:hypothetical protein [Chelatococcus sp. XZ-Ab1]|uniref:hypothetical protein n=1 Tax=Chelatococcus sp. XZ-Ab1 TaxID=3034027 RepID=UPI0023E43F3D|nr:hypothetical protein [Chelatococcus sp. XZ-Ab1]